MATLFLLHQKKDVTNPVTSIFSEAKIAQETFDTIVNEALVTLNDGFYITKVENYEGDLNTVYDNPLAFVLNSFDGLPTERIASYEVTIEDWAPDALSIDFEDEAEAYEGSEDQAFDREALAAAEREIEEINSEKEESTDSSDPEED